MSKEQLEATRSLLSHIDSFNLEDYIKAIRFDELKVPSVPFLLPQQKYYYGVSGQQQAELNFLKAAVLSKGTGPVFLYSDMEMADMAEDKEFSKKWMYGLALLLKKGVKLQYVHNLNRPFDELMLGLESLIPLYMTGQIEPYYLSGVQNEVFQHIYRVSDSVALFGESIHGYHEDGWYHVTANKEEVARYRREADHILGHAHSLMDIYQEKDTESLQRFIRTIANGDYITELISSSLPPYGMTTALMEEICRENGCTQAEQDKVLNYINLCEENLQQQLSAGIPLTIEIPDIREEDFEKESPALNLSPLFLGRKISYSPAQYRRHREALEKQVSANELLSLTANPKAAFRNMDICISKGKWVWISKHSHPNIHFVIHYSKLREAIENMILPIYEE
ncbi:MAG: hypothetical protein K6A92_02985 [Lachnospiraceae bacterium]|nr:hypothetical protein [Lachnospiraceae bacterium]